MDAILTLIISVLGTSFVSGVISTFVKDHSENKYWSFVMQVINILALNIGKAKNNTLINK